MIGNCSYDTSHPENYALPYKICNIVDNKVNFISNGPSFVLSVLHIVLSALYGLSIVLSGLSGPTIVLSGLSIVLSDYIGQCPVWSV